LDGVGALYDNGVVVLTNETMGAMGHELGHAVAESIREHVPGLWEQFVKYRGHDTDKLKESIIQLSKQSQRPEYFRKWGQSYFEYVSQPLPLEQLVHYGKLKLIYRSGDDESFAEVMGVYLSEEGAVNYLNVGPKIASFWKTSQSMKCLTSGAFRKRPSGAFRRRASENVLQETSFRERPSNKTNIYIKKLYTILLNLKKKIFMNKCSIRQIKYKQMASPVLVKNENMKSKK